MNRKAGHALAACALLALLAGPASSARAGCRAVYDEDSRKLLDRTGDRRGAAANFGKAADEFGKKLKEEPGNADLHNRAGSGWYSMGRYDNAVALIEQSVRLDPENADSWIGLGACHIALGRPDQAREQLLKAKGIHRRRGNLAGSEEAEDYLKKLR